MEIGAALLQLFVQVNYTGPALSEEELGWTHLPTHPDRDLHVDLCKSLEVDAEEIYPLIKYPSLLVLSRWLLVEDHAEMEVVENTENTEEDRKRKESVDMVSTCMRLLPRAHVHG